MLRSGFIRSGRIGAILVMSLWLAVPAWVLAEQPAALTLRRVSIQDPDVIGGDAASFLVPQGWKVEGKIVWRTHPALPAAAQVRVHDPTSATHLQVFPSMPFTWGDACGPGQLMPMGASWFGNEVHPPFKSAIECLDQAVLPRLRGDVQYKVLRSHPLPDLIAACKRNAPKADPGVTLTYDAATVEIRYSVQGVAVEEEFTCVLTSMRLPVGNIIIQIADPIFAMRAAPGELDKQRPVLTAILTSSQINPKWYNRYVQLVDMIVKAKMQEIKAVGEFSQMLGRTSDTMTRERRDRFDKEQTSKDRLNREWNEHNRGIETYDDPIEGRPVELPSGYSHAWVSRGGEYILTDNPNFNPNVEVRGDWQPMNPAP